MSTNVNRLELAWAERVRISPGSQTERHFLDFLIDGVSLRGLAKYGRDTITPLGGWATPEFEAKALDVLLCDHKPTLSTGRVELYVCAECGDIGCGSLTTVISDDGEFVTWREFGYEVNYRIHEDDPLVNTAPYDDVGPFRFEREQYRRALQYPPPRPEQRDH
jgi:hypothetical protein